ncbi:hypothetical protein [Paenibacillus sp. BK720]|uniref:hypothetical protein n=1 Tax=Paenibacillus sp. BK720 TaxID=2587092 RepID=UPI001ABBBEB9|nr:hypothetical protein [Paenibacillus sp. BK720]
MIKGKNNLHTGDIRWILKPFRMKAVRTAPSSFANLGRTRMKGFDGLKLKRYLEIYQNAYDKMAK